MTLPRLGARHKTYVTLPMRRRMRYLRALGLGSEAIAAMIGDEFNLPQPPSRDCIDVHAPKASRGIHGLGMAKGAK